MLSPSSASFSAPPAPAPLTPTLLAAQGGCGGRTAWGRPRRRWCPAALRRWTPSCPAGLALAGRDRAAGAASRGAGVAAAGASPVHGGRPRPYPTKPLRPAVGVRHGPSRRGARCCSSTRPTHRICRACRAWGRIQAGRHRRWSGGHRHTGAGAVDGGAGHQVARGGAGLVARGTARAVAAAAGACAKLGRTGLSGAARARRPAALGRATVPGGAAG